MRRIVVSLAAAALLGPGTPAFPRETAVVGGTPAARIEGSVSERSSGDPVADASIRLVVRESAYDRALRLLEARPVTPAAEVRSTADGGFELAVPAPGNYDLVVEAPGWVPAVLAVGPIGRLPASTPRVVTVTLDRGRSVSITVPADAVVLQEPTSERWMMPAVGARSWRSAPWEARPEKATQVEGAVAHAVAVAVPHAGSSTWRIGRPGAGTLPASCTLVAARGCTPTEQPSRSVQLEVVRAGKPLPGVVVVLEPTSFPLGRSNEAGRVAVPIPVGGRSALEVLAADGGRADLVIVDPGSASPPPVVKVDVPLAPRHIVAVRAAETRAPLAGVAIATAGGAFALSPANGRVELVAAPGEGVAATAAGRLEAATEIDQLSDTTLSLVAGTTLPVRVVDEAAAPIAGARVRAEPIFRPRPGSFQLPARLARRSDAKGRVSFGPLDGTFDWHLIADAPGRATGRVAATGLGGSTTAPELTVVLAKGSVAWVKVVDHRDQPIPGAEVSLEVAAAGSPMMMGFGGGQPPLRSVTSADGRARFDQVAVGTFVLEAKAPGFAPTRVPGLTIEVAGSETELGTVELAPETRVEVEVVERAGAPVAGASCWVDEQAGALMVLRTGGSERAADAISDQHGRASIGGQRAGTKITLLVRAEGFAEAGGTLDVDPGAEPMRLVLDPVSRLGGRVVDEGGLPISGASVGLELVRSVGAATFGMPRSATETAADGSFLFDGLEPGHARLTAAAPGRRTVRTDGIAVVAGESTIDHEIRLEPGATISGRVSDTDGIPLEGVRVVIPEAGTPAMMTMMRSGVATNADGLFRLEGAAVGMRLLEAHAAGFRPGKVELELVAGSNSVDFVLERGLSIAGRVVGPNREPVAGAQVRLAPEPGRPSFGAPGQTTDTRGGFRLEGLEPGTLTLIAEAEGLAAARSAPIELAADISGLELVLQRGTRIVGELRGLSLDQLGRVGVMATSRTGGRVMGKANFEGRYAIEGVGSGSWNVMAMLEGRTARGEVEIPAGADEVQLDLEMLEGATLLGRVIVDGEPGAGLRVHGTRAGAPGFFGSTDPAGAFRFEGLPAGTYQVSVAEMVSTVLTRQIEVEEPETTVELAVRTATVEGVVVREGDGSPIAGASVSVAGERAQSGPVATDSQGRFRLRRLPPGSTFVIAAAEGFAERRRELDLAEGALETVELELAGAAGLSLRVEGRSDTAIVGLLDDSGRVVHSANARIGPEGVVRLDSAPAGEWEGVVWAGWGGPGVFFRVAVPGEGPTITVPPLGSVELSIPGAEGAEVEVMVRDHTGVPVRWQIGTSVVAKRTSSSGRLSLPLFTGTWTIGATAADGRRWTGIVTVTAGAPAAIVLDPS